MAGQEALVTMRRGRRATHSPIEFGGSGEDSFVAVVVTKLTGALLFILLLSLVIMALLPKAVEQPDQVDASSPEFLSLAITSPETLPEAIAGRPYTVALAAEGGTGRRSWALDGPLPDGLSFDGLTATISGTPSVGTSQPVPLVARVTDGHSRDMKRLLLVVYRPDTPLSIPGPLAGRLPALPLDQWLSHGFGFLLLWLVHLLGLSVVSRLERNALAISSPLANTPRPIRFTAYRLALRLVTLSTAVWLLAWLVWKAMA